MTRMEDKLGPSPSPRNWRRKSRAEADLLLHPLASAFLQWRLKPLTPLRQIYPRSSSCFSREKFRIAIHLWCLCCSTLFSDSSFLTISQCLPTLLQLSQSQTATSCALLVDYRNICPKSKLTSLSEPFPLAWVFQHCCLPYHLVQAYAIIEVQRLCRILF